MHPENCYSIMDKATCTFFNFSLPMYLDMIKKSYMFFFSLKITAFFEKARPGTPCIRKENVVVSKQ